MLKIKEYVMAESLEQAYELNSKRSNRIVGGMLWMKMSNRQIQKAIDLSGLGLDTITETEDSYIIGAMVPLRELELHKEIHELTGGALRDALKDIVGVQFRNLATIGGSIYGRFGFSDVLTCFLALDSFVELYKGGIMSMQEFAERPYDNDILVNVILKKTPGSYKYRAHRNSRTDFPVLTCSVGVTEEKGSVVIGARPGKAVCLEIPEETRKDLMAGKLSAEDCKKLAGELAGKVTFGSNMRAGAEYREHLARVLIRRNLEDILKENMKEGGETE